MGVLAPAGTGIWKTTGERIVNAWPVSFSELMLNMPGHEELFGAGKL